MTSPKQSPTSSLVCEFFVAGRATAQPRAGPGRGGHMIMAPDDHSIRSWRVWIKAEAQRAMNGRVPITKTPLCVTITFRFDRPKRLLKPDVINQQVPHIVKPDEDNLRKAVQDACNRTVWSDDCAICEVHSRKRYVMPGEQPGVAVRVTIVDPSSWR